MTSAAKLMYACWADDYIYMYMLKAQNVCTISRLLCLKSRAEEAYRIIRNVRDPSGAAGHCSCQLASLD